MAESMVMSRLPPPRVVTDFPHRVACRDPVWVEMHDGVRLAARLWLPDDAERSPVPALLECNPYRRRDFTASGNASYHQYFAGNGYAVLRVDIRGSGDSEGLLEDEYTDELQDAVTLIRWAAGQPWCTGDVGMMGTSWSGINALQVAALAPRELKAIISNCSTDDPYNDDIHYMGGCLLNDNIEWSAVMLALNARPPDPAVVGDRWREMWLDRLRNQEHWLTRWLAHQARDDYWTRKSIREKYAAIRCPVYATGGWGDALSNTVPRLLAGLSCPRKGLLGPWGHSVGHLGVPGPTIGWLQEALRWWDHWLKGKDNGIMAEPMFRFWMQESEPPQAFRAARSGFWTAESSWPPKNVERWALSLGDGTLGDRGADTSVLTLRPHQTVGLTAGDRFAWGVGAELPLDQRGDDAHSLCFDSAPLEDRTEIVGFPEVILEVSVDRPEAFLCVRLCDVHSDGQVSLVSYGVLNLAHRDGHDRVSAVRSGQRFTVTVPLRAAAQGFAAGHRIRVAVSTAYWPFLWPSPRPVTLQVFPVGSRLILPARKAQSRTEDCPAFGTPEHAPPLAMRVDRPKQYRRTIRHDIDRDRVSVDVVRDRGAHYLEGVDLNFAMDGRTRFSIQPTDPSSACTEVRYHVTLDREDWHIRCETVTTVTCTESQFILNAGVDIFENDREIFSRAWQEQVSRTRL